MADEQNKFTHVGVRVSTQKKIAILAKVQGDKVHIYDLVGLWTDREWDIALQAGLVTNAMLEPKQQSAHMMGKGVVELDTQDGKKLLTAIKLQPVKKSKKTVKV